MKLNTLSPADGSRKNKIRVGRGIGSGLGKTSGRGHKGQKSRSGGFHKINFEGGQMPIQRRLPKTGFNSRVCKTVAELPLSALNHLDVEIIDLDVLKAYGLINKSIRKVKIFMSGELTGKVSLKNIHVSKGAREQIEHLGGVVEI